MAGVFCDERFVLCAFWLFFGQTFRSNIKSRCCSRKTCYFVFLCGRKFSKSGSKEFAACLIVISANELALSCTCCHKHEKNREQDDGKSASVVIRNCARNSSKFKVSSGTFAFISQSIFSSFNLSVLTMRHSRS